MHPRIGMMFLLVLFAPLLLTAGCGYTVYNRASLPFTEIRIGNIENVTLEPKLQDKLHQALVEEFAKYGVAVTSRAAPVLSGVIRNYSMISLSEKGDITVEYRIMIGVDFTYRDSTGKITQIKDRGLPFIVTFSGAGAIQNLLANRTVAEQQAMSDLAKSVIGTLIY